MTIRDISRLTAILNELIPANPDRGIPGAGDLGLADTLSSDTALTDAICALLSRAQTLAEEVSSDLVRQLEQAEPGAFAMVLTATYKAYYSRPDMRAKVGVGVHPVHPRGYDVVRETPELLDELTAPVRARGPIYRDPTGDAS